MYKMDGRGGCCIARYAGGGAYNMSKVDRIMLRFRPIAPKPATGGSVSPTESSGSEPFTRSGKGKRKYSRENGAVNKRCNNSNRKRKSNSANKTEPVATLPLLPDSPARSCHPGPFNKDARSSKFPMWLSFDKGGEIENNQVVFSGGSADRAVVMTPQAARVVWSSVAVECVNDTWVDVDALGSRDWERKVNLGRDTCPGFISDEFCKVTWANEAFRKMVGQEECEELVVWLVMKAPAPATLTYPAFTCRVRLQHSVGKEKSSLTLPCDAWRMDGGGFAWRLDVKAALCLGR